MAIIPTYPTFRWYAADKVVSTIAAATFADANPDTIANPTGGFVADGVLAGMVTRPGTTTSGGYSPLTTSVLFDGISKEVVYTDNANMKPQRTDAFSCSIWMQSATADNDYMFGKWGVSTGWHMIVATGGHNFRMIGPRAAVQDLYVTSVSGGAVADITDGNWHHLVATSGGNSPLTPADIEIYVDGHHCTGAERTDNAGSITNTTVTADAMRVSISGSYVGNLCHASGWDFALTPAQVAELYGSGAPQDLNAMSFAAPVFWDTLGDGDALGAGGMIDLISAQNGTATNMVGGDWVADVPVAATTANGAMRFTVDIAADTLLTLSAGDAVVAEGPVACTLTSYWLDRDGYEEFPGPFGHTNLVRSGGFSGGFTGIPQPWTGFVFSVTCNATTADAVPGTDEYHWYLSQRTDNPAKQYVSVVPYANPFVPGNTYSGTIKIDDTALAASELGISLPVTPTQISEVFKHCDLYCIRVADGAIQWANLLEEMFQVTR